MQVFAERFLTILDLNLAKEMPAILVTAVAIAVVTVCSGVVAIAFLEYTPSAIATAASIANAFTIANATAKQIKILLRFLVLQQFLQ